jgi:hypothetical protein
MNTNKPEAVLSIDDDMINKAIAAIESTEPTAEERESAQLAKLIPVICAARASGEPDERIRRKLKSVMPKLHYRKVNSLFEAASELANDQHDRVQGSAQ